MEVFSLSSLSPDFNKKILFFQLKYNLQITKVLLKGVSLFSFGIEIILLRLSPILPLHFITIFFPSSPLPLDHHWHVLLQYHTIISPLSTLPLFMVVDIKGSWNNID